MKAVLDIFQGDSFTIAFAMPSDYDMTRLTSAKVYFGSTLYAHIIEGVGENIIKATISSEDTAGLIYRQAISLTVEDAELGVKKIDAGFVNVLPVNSPYYSVSESNVYSVVISVVVTDTALSTSAALYNVLRGKTAYEYAVEGGYIGTEAQFYIDIAAAAIAVPYTGATNEVDLGEHSIATDSIRFDTTPRAIARVAGEMFYSADSKTLTMRAEDGGDIDLGQEPHNYYRNNEGTAIVDGDVVSLVPSPGMTIGVALTDATDNTLSNAVLGMVTVATIGSDTIGRISKSGARVRGLDTSAYAEGTLLYVDPANAGKLTSVRPMAPNHVIEVGVVAISHAVSGVIELKIVDHAKLIELSDVDGYTDAIADAEYFMVQKTTGVHQFITFADLKVILKAYNDTLYYSKTAIDNTVSTLQLKSEKGQANGYAGLDGDGLVPASQLPSYVDDIIEVDNFAALPAIGETGKIYVTKDTNKQWRWSGSAYVYITSGAVDSVAGKTGVVTLDKSDVGLANVDNTADNDKPVSSAQQTALDLKIDKTLAAAITTVGDTETFAVKATDAVWKSITGLNVKAWLETFFNAKYISFTGDQSIGGVKTFSASPIVPTPTNPPDAANKGYVDSVIVTGDMVEQTTGNSTTNVMSQKAVTELFEKWVGVEIDPTLSSSEPAPKSTVIAYRATELKRTGNLYHHKIGNSRIFNAFRPAIVNRATKKVDWWLNKNNPALRADGTVSNPDWTTQNIAIVVPTLYRRITILDELTGRYEVAYDIAPFAGAELFHVESAHSPGFATIDRTLTQLVSVISSDPRFRGGANAAGNDLLPSTQLAKPATGVSRINFENYAAAAGWETGNIADRTMWHELTAIYFANTNIQLVYTDILTADGYPQGGLGVGVTEWNPSRWSYRNGYYPIHNVGEGFMTIGCNTGVKNMVDEKYYVGAITSVSAGSLVATGNFAAGAGWLAGYIGKTVQNLQTLAEATITGKTDDNTLTLSADIFTTAGHWFWIKDVTYSYQIPVFFGLEHLYGEIWDWVSGVNIEKSAEIVNGGTGLSKAFVCTDFTKRAATITADYKEIGLVPRGDGYIKELHRDFAITKVNTGAASTTFMSDYGYHDVIPAVGTTVYGLLFGANASNGATAGVRASNAFNDPTLAHWRVGARLRARVEK